MPTPLGHFTVAHLIYTSKKTFNVPALIVGSIIPDLDNIFTFVTRGSLGREVLHSFVGVGTLGTFMSMLVVVLLYPLLVSTFFRIDKKEVRAICNLSKNSLASSFVGGLAHVLIDATCHNFNPLFYPFFHQSIDLLLFTSDWLLAYVVLEFFLLVPFMILIIGFSRKGVHGFWKQALLGY